MVPLIVVDIPVVLMSPALVKKRQEVREELMRLHHVVYS